MKPGLVLFILFLFCPGYTAADSARIAFERGARMYDSVMLKKALHLIDSRGKPPDCLFKAACLWRLQVVKYVVQDRKGTVSYGIRALAMLDSAELRKEDPYRIAAQRAYVSQLLASTGLKNGATYGPRTAQYLDAMKKMRPNGFDTEFITAVNFLEMPSFVGGDAKKALGSLEKLNKEYPDSAAVAISFARALAKLKRPAEARAVLDSVLTANPQDLWAKKVRRELK